eukprot:TRINITY_DN797_c3_g1_i2.p1 TRINITY_DN797_c3_g1~~TRINITY_DN797_c3_g1_i2.p1  ORF type:complete len:624 (+),score=131.67 TRINITY_DN797_c3_g1_i2:102-1973(+)
MRGGSNKRKHPVASPVESSSDSSDNEEQSFGSRKQTAHSTPAITSTRTATITGTQQRAAVSATAATTATPTAPTTPALANGRLQPGDRNPSSTKRPRIDAEAGVAVSTLSAVVASPSMSQAVVPRADSVTLTTVASTTQALAFKIAMDLLQQCGTDGDNVVSPELLRYVDQVMHHTQQFVALAKRHAPPFPPTLGLFCILPAEVIMHLFSFMGPHQLTAARLVCKLFASFSRDQTLWKALTEKRFGITHNKLYEQLKISWEWLYRCKSTRFTNKADIYDGAIGTYVDQSQGLNERYEGQWSRREEDVTYRTFFSRPNAPIIKVSLNGYGMFIDEHNIVHEGEWANGRMHGRGREFSRLHTAKQYEYIGQFQDDLWTGEGVCSYGDGSAYQGQWVNGAREGLGVMTYSDGRKFDGLWKQGKRNGRGTLTWPSGAQFKGEWCGDEITGGGLLVSNNGKDTYQKPSLEEALTLVWNQVALLEKRDAHPHQHHTPALSPSTGPTLPQPTATLPPSSSSTPTQPTITGNDTKRVDSSLVSNAKSKAAPSDTPSKAQQSPAPQQQPQQPQQSQQPQQLRQTNTQQQQPHQQYSYHQQQQQQYQYPPSSGSGHSSSSSSSSSSSRYRHNT